MERFPDFAQLENAAFIEDLYRRYVENPSNVDSSWRHFFEGMDFSSFLDIKPADSSASSSALRVFLLIQSYRRYGHLLAPQNPINDSRATVHALDLERLGFASSELTQAFPTLGLCGKSMAPLSEILTTLRDTYCTRIGFEYMDLSNKELEVWIQQRIEPKGVPDLSIEEKRSLLEALHRSEIFETFLHTRYVGQTRFSIEGTETAIPMLAEMLDQGSALGMKECWIGMAHRGRLNVLANILNKPYSMLFEEFEDDTSLSFFGNDDVKYHMGFKGEFVTRNGEKITVGLPPNPSHLESVDPVLLGHVRARQTAAADQERRGVVPILIHGDAALAGQGVVYESLQFMTLPDYSVGGTIHLVLNNQIGYTTLPEQGRSTRYCTDIAKTFGAPVFHVNAEDPESCLFAAKLAVEIRQRFQCDVFLDLLGYRKYGHNEGDEPSYTQPIQYQVIRTKKTIRQLYFEQLVSAGFLEQKLAETLEAAFRETLKKALAEAQAKKKKKEEGSKHYDLFQPFSSGVNAGSLREIMEQFCFIPEGFHLHPKLQKWLQERRKLEGIDWACAECLALGSLLREGIPVRLAGEDTQRGTFSQRHMVWIDAENGGTYSPFGSLKGRFDAVNSPLTEYAGMGFEYGYSCGDPNTLVLWEAQYGDFNNGAQIIIDQYIASAEQKWNTSSSFCLLLPHAFEGAGPEHSSARLERFLQLAALDNIQIVNASTPSQLFHLLRRQALRAVKKPLVLFTPKGLLRASACTSRFEELFSGNFLEILPDPSCRSACKRLLLCSGKVFYDLFAERERRKITDIAIVRIEQLYPLHLDLLKKTMAVHKGYSDCFWVQEEPENMGAWSFLFPILSDLMPKGAKVSYVGRESSATPATGSHLKHKQEQKSLIDEALQ